MPTNKELEQRVITVEQELAFLTPREPDVVSSESFYDLLVGVIEALIRTRSSGAYRVASELRDKYLDPEVSLDAFGEEFVKTGTLASAPEKEQ